MHDFTHCRYDGSTLHINNQKLRIFVGDVAHSEVFQSGGHVYIDRFVLSDGKVVVISDEVICIYPSKASYEAECETGVTSDPKTYYLDEHEGLISALCLH